MRILRDQWNGWERDQVIHNLHKKCKCIEKVRADGEMKQRRSREGAEREKRGSKVERKERLILLATTKRKDTESKLRQWVDTNEFGRFLLLYNMNWANSSWSLTLARVALLLIEWRAKEREKEAKKRRKVKWACSREWKCTGHWKISERSNESE